MNDIQNQAHNSTQPGEVPPDNTLHPEAPKSFYQNNRTYLWGSLCAAMVIGILGYFVFFSGSGDIPDSESIEVKVDVPKTAVAGNDTVLKFNIHNKNSKTLTNLRLSVVYPNGLEFVSSVPPSSSLTGNEFKIPDLLPDQSTVIVAKVKVKGAIDSEQKVSTTLRYEFSGMRSSYTKSAEGTIRLTAAEVSLSFGGSGSTPNGLQNQTVLRYKNDSGSTLENTRITVTFPENYTLVKSDPDSSLSKNIWDLGDLENGSEGEIKLFGVFDKAVPGSEQNFKAVLATRSPQGTFSPQTDAVFSMKIEDKPLQAVLVFDGDKDLAVKPKEVVAFTVNYKNNQKVAANKTIISVAVSGNAADLSTLEAGDARLEGQTIVWDAANTPELELLKPGQDAQLKFTVKIKDQPVKDESVDPSVKFTASIKSLETDQISAEPVQIKIATVSALSASVTAAAGEHPPRVGQASYYTVVFKVDNSTSSIAGAKMTATVPLGPGSVDTSSIAAEEKNKVSFDPATGKLVWNIGSLNAHLGDFNPSRKLSFKIKLTPAQNQVGQGPVLVNKISFTGTDSFTKRPITMTASDLSTASVGGYSNESVQP